MNKTLQQTRNLLFHARCRDSGRRVGAATGQIQYDREKPPFRVEMRQGYSVVEDNSGSSGSHYYVSLWLPAAVLGALLIVTLTLQVAISWKAHRQMAPVNSHIALMVRLQGVNLELQRVLIEILGDGGVLSGDERTQMRNELKAILGLQAHLMADTPQSIASAHDVLADAAIYPTQALILALSHLRKAIAQEAVAHQRLIEKVERSTAMDLDIGIITLLAFPTGAILLIYLMRRRILAPLKHLGFLMTLLARRDYSPAPVAAIDPLLRPLTENYNKMVTRLSELEKEHEARERDLEGQVESATRALLEQHRSLANTERLAAVGEMMARIAHELRNPLAGVKLACTNLRQELNQRLGSPEYNERIDMVTGEIDRIITMQNTLLDHSRHKPEPSRDITIARTVRDLIELTRYQLPMQVRLEQRIPGDIVCRLPEALFRQSLLNLFLNAWQALGEQEGRITIEAVLNDGMLRLDVRDDGPGFPRDLLEYGIRAFITHRAGGTGLGLSMVQRFARALGGSVTLSNREPHGACVTLELPCGKYAHA
jgi:two-component system NtrC family sensor kinase